MNSTDIWKREIGPLHDLRLNWNDKLEVFDDSLRLVKGLSEEPDGLLFIPEPKEVAEHLNFLITKTANVHLSQLKDLAENYEQVADFKREFKCLNNLISSLRHIFKDNHQMKPYACLLYERSSKFFSEIIEYKRGLKKPLLKDRTCKPIEYNERTELSSIKSKHPKRVPLSETIKAAHTALTLAEPKINESLEYCVKPLFCCLITFSALKVVFLNPLECLYYGKVETRTPLKLAVDEYINNNRHIQAYQKFTRQILNCELITNEAAFGFAKLAPYATTLDLSKAKFIDEKPDINHPQIDENCLSILLEAASSSNLCNTIHISKSLLEWNYVLEFLSKHYFLEADDRDHSITYIRKPVF